VAPRERLTFRPSVFPRSKPGGAISFSTLARERRLFVVPDGGREAAVMQ